MYNQLLLEGVTESLVFQNLQVFQNSVSSEFKAYYVYRKYRDTFLLSIYNIALLLHVTFLLIIKSFFRNPISVLIIHRSRVRIIPSLCLKSHFPCKRMLRIFYDIPES